MAHSIKTVYVIHHSHTDIGYTDLAGAGHRHPGKLHQTVLSMMEQPANAGFRWNCETLFCGGVLEIRNGGGAGSLSQIGGGGKKLACLPII